MKKNKINLNPTPLTQEDIQAGKNFDAFYNLYQKSQPSSLLRRIGLPALAAAAVFTIALLLFRMPDASTQMVAAFVEPPIKGLERTYEQISFVVEQGLLLNLPSGTVINIPANAFIDADGRPYTGEATLKYREYTDPLSIALSGIPMSYDSAGTKYTFESAGMFDIAVEARGADSVAKNLSLANGAVVSVGMPATNTDEDFNIYELDTANRNWALRGQDSIAMPEIPATEPAPAPTVATNTAPQKNNTQINDPKLKSMLTRMQMLNDSIAYYKEGKFATLVKPQKSHVEAHRFNVLVNEVDYPELVLPALVTWEVAPLTPGFESVRISKSWDKRTISRVGTGYSITIEREGVEHTFACKPVYHGTHYATAIKYYEQELTKRTERQGQLETIKIALQTEYDTYKASLLAAAPAQEKELLKQEQVYKNEATLETTREQVYRYVEVARMGIWNIDRIYKQPGYLLAETEFLDKQGEIVEMHRMILFEKGVNGSFEFFKMPNKHTMRFIYNPASTYTGIGITTAGQVFLVKPSDIKQVKTEGINVIKAHGFFTPKSEDELRQKLKALV